MNKQDIKKFLLDNRGYIKYSIERTASKLRVNPNLVRAALKEIRQEESNKPSREISIVDINDNPLYREFLEYREELERKKKAGTKTSYRRTLPRPFTGGDKKNVLVIGDTHLPFELEGYLEFCREQQERFNCGTVVHIGDLVDFHASSYHEHDADGKSAGDEYTSALDKAKDWYTVFPEVKICYGNHDVLPARKAFSQGLSKRWVKTLPEILESPKGWDWAFTHDIEGVLYTHGTGTSGEMAAINSARENRQSTVIGHLHTVSNIKFMASYKDLIFGMTVGCGINHEEYAFAYAKQQTKKPVISCGIVLGGTTPIVIPMSI